MTANAFVAMIENAFVAIERLYRRVLMMVCRGRVAVANDAGAVRILQVKFGANELLDSLPQVQEYGLSSMPFAGCDAIAIFIGGERSNGAVIASNDQRFRPRNLQSGEVMLYDDLGQKIHLTRSGIVISSPLKIRQEAPEIEIHATTSFRFDVNGHGQHWRPDHVDTWQNGETAGTAHSIAPPEIV